MKPFIMAVIIGVLLMGAMNYQSEVTNAGELVEIQENYGILLRANASWGSVQLDPYLYVSGSDATLRIYNPQSKIVYETVVKAGSVFDEVLFLEAEKGTWMMEVSAPEAMITYDSSLKTLYLKSFGVENPLRYQWIQWMALFVVVLLVISFCPLRALVRSKSIIERHHDADGLIELSKSLQCSYLSERIRNYYALNIAAGHIYNGDYQEAKKVLDEMVCDRSGEVKILKKWLKLYYLYYISLLLELDQLEEAETLLEQKREVLEKRVSYSRDPFLTSFLKALMKMNRAEYDQAKEQFVALKNMAESDYEKSGVYYRLAEAYYHLGDKMNAQAYLNEARKTAYFKGIQEKIEDLEHKICY